MIACETSPSTPASGTEEPTTSGTTEVATNVVGTDVATTADTDGATGLTSETTVTDATSETTDTDATSETTVASTGETEEGTSDPATTVGELDVVKVLFIGNSYTTAHDLAGLVSAMAASEPAVPELMTQVIAIGGETMAGHLTTPSTIAVIENGSWDFVVLQGQSVEPLVPGSDFIEAGIELAAIVAETGATPMLFETWARQAGHELYQEPWYGETPAQAQAGLRAAYLEIAVASGAIVAAVGDAWEIVWTQSPMIQLYTSDGSHPELAGSYVAAAVFYKAITGETPIGNPGVPSGIDSDTAHELQQAADNVVP